MAKDSRPWEYSNRRLHATLAGVTAKLRGRASLPTTWAPTVVDVGFYGVRRMAMRAQREERVLDAFLDTLWAGSRVYDVGACLGLWSVHAKTAEPTCTVRAFEPYPPNHDLLQRNADIYGIRADRIALGNEQRSIGMEDVGSGVGSAAKARPELDMTSVPASMYPLDTITACEASPTHLKIDVEGFELEVLEGARDTLKDLEAVVVECHNQTHTKVFNRLDCAGFQIKTFGQKPGQVYHWLLGTRPRT